MSAIHRDAVEKYNLVNSIGNMWILVTGFYSSYENATIVSTVINEEHVMLKHKRSLFLAYRN